MITNRFETLRSSFIVHLAKQYKPTPELTKQITFSLNTDPQKSAFGDISSNAAMILAKELKKNPRQVAEEITQHFNDPVIEKIEIAGPGFLNLHINRSFFELIAQDLFIHPTNFFKPETSGIDYSLEFVSANPTGPLHLGHGRGGIIGDVLGNILSFINNNTIKEFYINDGQTN